jgi:hypothetical protein
MIIKCKKMYQTCIKQAFCQYCTNMNIFIIYIIIIYKIYILYYIHTKMCEWCGIYKLIISIVIGTKL